MLTRRSIALSLGLLLTGAVSIGLYGQTREGRRSRTQTHPTPPPGAAAESVCAAAEPDRSTPQPTRVQIDLFELACTTDQLIKLNPDALYGADGEGCSGAEVLKQLGEWGTARLLVRVDNVVDLAHESSLTHGKRVPTVQDMVVGTGGKVTPSVSYQQVGVRAKIRGMWHDCDGLARADLECAIELSSVTRSSTEIGAGVKLPVLGEFEIAQHIFVTSGKPVFIVSNDVPMPGDGPVQTVVTVLRLMATRLPG